MSGISQFKSIAPESVVGWDQLAPALQTQVQQAVSPDARIECVVYPQTQAELAEVMACAHRDRVPVLVCGSGSKLHWGGLARGVRVVISTARLDRLVEHAVGDLTVTAEAGMPFARLQAGLAKEGQFLAIDPAYPASATLGGIVATADAGSLRHRYGGIRDMLIGVSLVRSDGQLAKAGGRVVKNVAGYDLMKLLTGAWGTLGILSQVTFRIYPLTQASQTVVLTGEPSQMAQATQTLLASALTPIAADLLAPQTVAELGLGQGLGLLTQFCSIAVSVQEQAKALLQVGEALHLKAMTLSDADEASLWQAFKQLRQPSRPPAVITCKIGVLPSEAIALLTQISALPTLRAGWVHAQSGLGLLQLEEASIDVLAKLRSLCQSSGGYLTVLAAPLDIKQQFDLWGDVGNALPLMQKLKQQFDAENLLSPGRFVAGI